MLSGKKNKNLSRPKKTGTKKRRRILEHRNRLIALGVPAEKVTQLDVKEMRSLLKCPKKTAVEYSK